MKMLSVKDYAAKWSLSERTVRELIRDERLPGAVKVGGAYRIPEDVEPLQAGETAPTEEPAVEDETVRQREQKNEQLAQLKLDRDIALVGSEFESLQDFRKAQTVLEDGQRQLADREEDFATHRQQEQADLDKQRDELDRMSQEHEDAAKNRAAERTANLREKDFLSGVRQELAEDQSTIDRKLSLATYELEKSTRQADELSRIKVDLHMATS